MLIKVDEMEEFLFDVAAEAGLSFSPYSPEDFDFVEVDGEYYYRYDL